MLCDSIFSALYAIKYSHKSEYDIKLDKLKEEFSAHVTLPNEEWEYSYLTDLEGNDTAAVCITADNFTPDEFYDMLCTIKNIKEYMQTRADCKDKNLKVKFCEHNAGTV